MAPAGHGTTLVLGLARGFRALQAPGAIPRLPRLAAIQTAASLAGPSLGLPAGVGDTITEGIRVR